MPFAGYSSPDLRKRVAALIVTQALLPAGNAGGFQLHPCLERWQEQLRRRGMQWFATGLEVPLSWYAAIAGQSPSRLLASRLGEIPADTQQIWVASPYHARLGRDSVHLLPEGQLGLTKQDALWLCQQLNPLLQEDGLQLHAVGAALLLTSRRAWDVQPPALDAISGRSLPDRHPEGADAGRMARLLAEIQMHLHRHPARHRQQSGEHDLHGLWFWAADTPATDSQPAAMPVASRNPCLQSVTEARGARLIVSEAERLGELVGGNRELPDTVILSGPGYALQLHRRLLGRWRGWKLEPVREGSQQSLLQRLRKLLHAA